MFLDQEFESAQDGEKIILECNPLEEAKIRNHTCVLAPEVTQGEFLFLDSSCLRQSVLTPSLSLSRAR